MSGNAEIWRGERGPELVVPLAPPATTVNVQLGDADVQAITEAVLRYWRRHGGDVTP